jgi:stage III sporulation protein AG
MGDGFWQKIKAVLTGRDQAASRGKGPSALVLLALIVVGIVFMFISVKPEEQRAPVPPAESVEVVARPARQEYRESLERDLAAMLRRARGVGEVAVLITLDSGPVYEYAESREATGRETREVDSGGGTRHIRETAEKTQPVVMRADGGKESPLVAREVQPGIRGVIVVAEGAENPYVYEQLFRAVQSGLNLAAHRITILPMK